MYKERSTCRLCGNGLDSVVDFGDLALTSQFPEVGEDAIRAPLHLMKCDVCGLLQLKHTVDPKLMYTEKYGYLSGVNETMVAHLNDLVDTVAARYNVGPEDNVLDIASNDGTLLRAWEKHNVMRYGCDPIGAPVKDAHVVRKYFDDGWKNLKVITSVAVLYDLDDPKKFANDVATALTDDGVWVVEVQYAGEIFEGKWDQICHEHLCYYGLSQLMHLGSYAGLYFDRAELNESNGGSIRAYFTKSPNNSLHRGAFMVNEEAQWDSSALGAQIALSAKEIATAVRKYDRVVVLGASTKGNVIMQVAGLTSDDIVAAVDRNPTKHGRVLPGSGIAINREGFEWDADAYLVLPYHFRSSVMKRQGPGRYIFPLPNVSVVCA